MYYVIYRTGGTENCTWNRVFTMFQNMKSAIECKKEIEKQGYKSIIHKSKALLSIGMPEGWDA